MNLFTLLLIGVVCLCVGLTVACLLVNARSTKEHPQDTPDNCLDQKNGKK